MLTVKMLKDMPPHTVFAQGEIVDGPKGLNMTGSGNKLKWIAKRGGIHDWAIYCHWNYQPIEFIKNSGDKVTNKTTIRKLVECDDESFEMYRY